MTETIKKTLFVRNLPFNITNEQFESLFSDYGPIKSCFTVRDRESGKCRGFGYVKYSMKEDAETAMKSVKSLDGRKLFVHFADKKPKQKKKKKPGLMEDDDDDEDDEEEDAKEAEPAPTPPAAPVDLSARARRRDYCTVIIGNLTETTYDADVKPVLTAQKNHRQTTYPVPGREADVAKVLFKSKRDALKAVKRLNNMKVKDAKLSAILLPLEKAQKKEETQKLKQTRLIIRNLSFKITDEKLRDAFKKFGEISEVHIPKKPDGKMLGFGFVQFTKIQDASNAVNAMNAKPILNRPVAVDWAIPKKRLTKLANNESDEEQEDSGSYSSSGDEKDEESEEEDDAVSATSEEEGEEEENEEEVSDTSEEEEEEEEMEVEEGSDSEASEEEASDMDDSDEASDTGDEDEDSDEGFSDDEDGLGKKKSKAARSSDVDEGKTLFIRNLSYDTEEEALEEFFEEFGAVKYARIVVDPQTEHSRGTAFVQFKNVEDTKKALAASEEGTKPMILDGRKLSLALAMSRDKAGKLQTQKKEKEAKDGRNLYLAREGLIRPGTQDAEGLSTIDLNKRQKVYSAKHQKLKDPNFFISTTRLSVHNIPVTTDDKRLRQIFKNAVDDKKAKITECRIMRDLHRVNAKGEAKSRGYGFVNFSDHRHALEALRQTNNNPDILGEKRRLIVEFSLENRSALAAKEKRQERMKAKQESLQKGRNFSEVKVKKRKRDDHLPMTSAKSSLAEVEAEGQKRQQKGPKGLPSHWGPKIRHRDRGNAVQAVKPKDKHTRKEARQAKEDKRIEAGLPKAPKARKRGIRAEIRDPTDKLINSYKQRFTAAYNKGKAAQGAKSKWFDS